MRRTILISVTIIIALLSSGFFYIRSMPHYSLYLFRRAIENHEPDEALKYINIDSIVDNLGRNFLGKDGGDNSQETGKNTSLKRMVTDALPGIKESIRSSFRAAIASHGNGKQNGKPAIRTHKNPLFSVGGIEISNLDLQKIKKISLWDLDIRVDGRTGLVQLKDTPGIKAKMVKTDTGYWQVVEIILSP